MYSNLALLAAGRGSECSKKVREDLPLVSLILA